MSTAFSSMQQVTIPRFAPSSSAGQSAFHQSDAGGSAPAFVSDVGGDGLDFDLLAEYLLDDSLPSMDNIQLPTFEFQ